MKGQKVLKMVIGSSVGVGSNRGAMISVFPSLPPVKWERKFHQYGSEKSRRPGFSTDQTPAGAAGHMFFFRVQLEKLASRFLEQFCSWLYRQSIATAGAYFNINQFM